MPCTHLRTCTSRAGSVPMAGVAGPYEVTMPHMFVNRCTHGHGLELKLNFGFFLEFVQALYLDAWLA